MIEKILYYPSNRFKDRFLLPRYLSRIRHDEDLPADRKKALKCERLEKTLDWAARTVPYYREWFRSGQGRGFSEIPPLERRAIQTDAARFVSERAPKHNRFELSTTGSSGTPLRIPMTKEEMLFSRALVLYGFIRSGVKEGSRVALIQNDPRSSSGALRKDTRDLFRWYSVDLKNELSQNVRVLDELKAEVLYSYPSCLSLVARHLEESQARFYRPSFVITHGEVLTAPVRELLKRVFRCEVRNSYGSTEFYRIAYECAEQKLHALETAHVLETAKSEEGGQAQGGEILVTSLYHRTMPFVRYRLGDRVVLSDRHCRCGAEGTVIEDMIGREDDLLILPSGRRITARAVNLLDDVRGVLQYRIVQKEKGLFEVAVCAGAGFDGNSERQIRRAIQTGCRPEAVDVNIVRTDSIPRCANGKLNAVVSEVLES